MNIGLETTWINVSDGGGRYTNEVVRHLCQTFPDERFFAFGPLPQQPHDYPNLTFVERPDSVGLPARLRYALTTGQYLKRHRIDVYHNLVNFGVYRSPCPQVTTVHDLLTLKFPGLRSLGLHGWLYRHYIPSLLKRASCIIAVSHSTLKDIREFYTLSCRMEAIHSGYSTGLFSPDPTNDDQVMAAYDLTPGYLFCVGNVLPKKNFDLAVQALALLHKRGLPETTLVIAGPPGFGSERLHATITALGLEGSVRLLGFVPDDHLAALYRQARVFLFPSLYEGFGLPILESMACGTPTVVSDAGPMPELVPDASFTAPPDNPVPWADRIEALLTNGSRYTEWKKRGLERVAMFSWTGCVSRYMEIYRSLARQSR